MNEKEMREAKVITPKNIDELITEIKKLTEMNHDYGTAVYAMSMAAVATFNYIASELHVTGFQASCADLDILRRTRQMEHGFKVIDFNRLLYPQYVKEFPITYDSLLIENIEHLSEAAKKNLNDCENAHPKVIKHWKMIANMPCKTPQNEL